MSIRQTDYRMCLKGHLSDKLECFNVAITYYRPNYYVKIRKGVLQFIGGCNGGKLEVNSLTTNLRLAFKILEESSNIFEQVHLGITISQS